MIYYALKIKMTLVENKNVEFYFDFVTLELLVLVLVCVVWCEHGEEAQRPTLSSKLLREPEHHQTSSSHSHSHSYYTRTPLAALMAADIDSVGCTVGCRKLSCVR